MDGPLMFTEVTILLGLSLLSCLIIVFIILSYLIDFKRLSLALNQLRESGTVPARLVFRDAALSRFWEFARSQRGQLMELKRELREKPELSQFGAELLRRSSPQRPIGFSLIDSILERTGSDVVGAGVILRHPEEGCRLDACRGVPRERFEETLLSCADYLYDNPPEGSRRYFDESTDPRFDFRSFSIGRSYFYSFNEASSEKGLLWIGLRQGQLPSDIIEEIEGLANYAAASFQSVLEIEQTLESKNTERDFLLGLSHDLRSPGNRALFAIRDILHSSHLSIEDVERLRSAEDSILEQLRMLGNVLDLAKHDNGLLDPSPSDIPLHSFLAQVVQRFEPEYKNKGLQLELRCRNPVTARADREHLVRIFNNLLSNAVKFTSSGGLIIEVRVEAGTAFISFLDTGEGVPQAERDLIFNRFDQGTQGRRKGGVGLGLFLSQALAERNGGQLYFIEPPFGGSQFVLELPYVSQANHHTKGVSPTSVLIVEDDLATARMLKRYVSSVCSEVRMAESTEEAQRLLSASRPDIIISDLHFQGRSATEFFEGIPKSIPLLVISGESRANVSARITRRGPLMIMEKPVEANEVLAALKELSHQTLDYQQVMNQ